MNLSITPLTSLPEETPLMSLPPLMWLPEDKLLYLSSFLDSTSLYRLARTCKIFNEICNDDSLWEKFVTDRGLKLVLNNQYTVLLHINNYNNKIYKLIRLCDFSIPKLEMLITTNKIHSDLSIGITADLNKSQQADPVCRKETGIAKKSQDMTMCHIDIVEAKALIDQKLATLRRNIPFQNFMTRQLNFALEATNAPLAKIFLEANVLFDSKSFSPLNKFQGEELIFLCKEMDRIAHMPREMPEMNEIQQSLHAIGKALQNPPPHLTIQDLLEKSKKLMNTETPLKNCERFLDFNIGYSLETLKLLMKAGLPSSNMLLTSFIADLHLYHSSLNPISGSQPVLRHESAEIIELFITYGARTVDLTLRMSLYWNTHSEIIKALMKGWDLPVERALEIARQQNASEEIMQIIRAYQQ